MRDGTSGSDPRDACGCPRLKSCWAAASRPRRRRRTALIAVIALAGSAVGVSAREKQLQYHYGQRPRRHHLAFTGPQVPLSRSPAAVAGAPVTENVYLRRSHPSAVAVAVEPEQQAAGTRATLSRTPLDQLCSSPLLTFQEELELGACVQALMAFEERRKALSLVLEREPTLEECAASLDLEPRVLERQVRSGLAAKRQLVVSNMRLVLSVGRKYQNNGVALCDLVQEGAVGLVRAAEKYDPQKGFRFSTYAMWWIRQRMQMALRSHRLVRVPVRLQDLWLGVRKARKVMEGELERCPSDAEVAERVGLSVAHVRHLRRIMRAPLSLDKRVHFTTAKTGSSTMQLVDMLAAATTPPDRSVEWGLMRDELETCMQRELNQLERDIVRMRSGLDDGRAKSATELSGVFKIPAPLILKEERKALSKLRLSQASQTLREYTEVADCR